MRSPSSRCIEEIGRKLDETYRLSERDRARPRNGSRPRTGCATTITSSRTRSARSARICRGSSTSSCRSWPTARRATRASISIARELIAHTAGRFDLETLVDFTAAYQRVAPLSIGETWAMPIMLRLGLVEELRRLGGRRRRPRATAASRRASGKRRSAKRPVGRDGTLDRLLPRKPTANGRLSAAFVVELLQWLRDQPSSAAPAWQALQRALEAQGDSAEEMLRVEHQREAADQLAIGNVITSMRLLSSIDWPLFFERVSVVERDPRARIPAGAYAEMDFPTRDRYRHAVEQLAQRLGEAGDRRRAAGRRVRRGGAAHDPRATTARHHVGYYLISRGRFRLEERARLSPSVAGAAGAVRVPASGASAISGRSRLPSGLVAGEPAGLCDAAWRRRRRAVAGRRCWC